LAYEWRIIDRVPRIRLLAGERNRESVLSHAQEELYLTAAPQPGKDVALLIADAGLRISEALNLEWRHVPLEPANGARFGYSHIPGGKSKNARRNVPLTDRVKAMLVERSQGTDSVYVFPSETGRPYRVQSIDHLHKEVRERLRLPEDFVIYSLRHTYGTRLGESGADAFTIMRLMGHSSVTVSQRYVHPTPEALERAMDGLQAMNVRASKSLPERQKRQLPATVSATVGEAMAVSD
jgi:integrase